MKKGGKMNREEKAELKGLLDLGIALSGTFGIIYQAIGDYENAAKAKAVANFTKSGKDLLEVL